MTGGRAAAASWARHDLRRRWVSLVALGILAGVTAGVALAAFAGARRTATALPRLEAATHAASAVIFASQVGELNPDWGRLRARPEVKELAIWDLLFGSIGGQPGAVIFGSDDGTYFGSVDHPIVVRGRMYDPRAPDEVVVDQHAVSQAPVGSTFSFQANGPDQANAAFGDPPDGPTFTLHVVGEVKEIDQYLFVPDGQVFTSPAFIEQNRSRILALPNAQAVVRPGRGGVAALQRDVHQLVAPGTPVLDLAQVSRRVTTTLDVERVALLLLGVAVVLAGGFLVAQALGRSAALIGDDVAALQAIGLTRSDVAVAGALAQILTTAAALVVTFVTAALLSDAFPVGLGRQIDPNPGFHIDWVVLAPGVLVAGALVVVYAWAVARRTYGRGAAAEARPSSLASAIRRSAPAAVGLGAGMAFDKGRGVRSIPVRPALAGAVVGVAGVVATFSINQGIVYALHHPALAGVNWDAEVSPNPGDLTARGISPDLASKVETAAGPAASVAVRDRYVLPVNGVGVPAFSLRSPTSATPAAFGMTVTSGRAPAEDREADIGPATARELGVKVGDQVRIGDPETTVRLVGAALFPTDPHSEFDEGIWLTPGGYDALVPPLGDTLTGGDVDRLLAVQAPPGESGGALVGHLGQALGGSVAGVGPPVLPPELTNLRNITVLPVALAVFLALVAIAAVSLALVASSRRRRRDFAILRALGLAPAGTRLVVNSQGTAIGLFGLVFGVPLGIAAGRLGWRLVAQRVPLAADAPLSLLAVLALIPITVAVVNVLAVLLGRSVARRWFPAEALRAE
ncbi:MAG TPA: ABC transporter permease [Actinomycetota bacterium]|nr:ABC transporter permease [Actinomycetota bacterium]